jgi:redox-sensitive bicupin YhaK (pirin superfamily)
MFYADVTLAPGAGVPLPEDHEDRGAYVLSGSVSVGAQVFEAGRMMVFRPGDQLSLRAGEAGARVLLLGGETLNGPRYISWNFVASSRELIEAAKADWASRDLGRFALPPGDDTEFIPLP